MRIIVNDIAASTGGAMTILTQFYNYIREYDNDNEWFFLLGDRYLDDTEKITILCLPEVKKSHFKKVVFDCLVGKKYIERLRPDVVVSLQNIITFGVKCPQLVYIHQSIPFQNTKRFSFFNKNERAIALIQYGIGHLIKVSARRADYVAVQTEWMKKAVSHKAGIKKENIIKVFPEAEVYVSENNKQVIDFDKTRFFYPTSNEIYKNNGLIIKACNLLNKRGIRDFEVSMTLPEGTYVHPNIKCVGRLDASEMINNYQQRTLVFPSYIETVGLPLLEARGCGTMVLASDTPFSHECLDGYPNGYFFDPFDPETLSNIMEQVILGEKVKQKDGSVMKSVTGWQEILKVIYSCGDYK